MVWRLWMSVQVKVAWRLSCKSAGGCNEHACDICTLVTGGRYYNNQSDLISINRHALVKHTWSRWTVGTLVENPSCSMVGADDWLIAAADTCTAIYRPRPAAIQCIS